MPMRGTFVSRCCALATSGHATAPQPITLMKSRRRIAHPKAQDHADISLITSGICDPRNMVVGSVRTAPGPSRRCPLWVKSRHPSISNQYGTHVPVEEPSTASKADISEQQQKATLFDHLVDGSENCVRRARASYCPARGEVALRTGVHFAGTCANLQVYK